jgi:SMC interacting uncharacterized protein involved in chromosome segregation
MTEEELVDAYLTIYGDLNKNIENMKENVKNIKEAYQEGKITMPIYVL